MQKVEGLSSKRIKLIFTVNTTVSIYAMFMMHINPTPKGIYTKLSVLHQYIRQMGPTCVKSYEQNVPHKHKQVGPIWERSICKVERLNVKQRRSRLLPSHLDLCCCKSLLLSPVAVIEVFAKAYYYRVWQ